MRPERIMTRTLLWSLVLGPALLLAALVFPATAAAADPLANLAACSGTGTVACDLYAEPGTAAITSGTTVDIWGFATSSGGTPTAPGPSIVVTEGDQVTVTVHNNLSALTGVTFDGQAMAPDLTGIAPGASKPYTFTASTPGTYLYEAGLIPGTQYQVSMGLYGVLIVRPSGAPGQAYGDAATAFSTEAVVVLSEIDPSLNSSSAPESFDLRYFAPRYQLINGVAYEASAPTIAATSGQQLLLRYVNAGIQHHSMAVLGLHQAELALDGSRLPGNRTVVAETINPGESLDALISLPAASATSTKYAVYDAAMLLNNNGGTGFGGMLTFIDASAAGSTADTVGPLTSGIALDTATGDLSATVSDAGRGDSNIAAAEFFVDATGATGSGTPMSGAFAATSETVTGSAAVPSGGWPTGTHTVYVRGQDAAGNWGPLEAYSFTVDATGPTTSALALDPPDWNGTGDVTLTGTASDAASGGSNVDAAEYFLGAAGADGSGAPVTLNLVAPITSLTAVIPQASIPVAGATVYVHARDAAGNWGDFATIPLGNDHTGPATSGVAAAPNPNNGLLAINTAYPDVRVTATVSDAASGGSTVTAAEGFIDTAGADGSGFPFTPDDGLFDTTTEAVTADIPLTTIRLLPDGNHTIYVHGRDAAGNWGSTSSTVLVVDKTGPAISGVTIVPNTIAFGTASVQLSVSATDAITGVTGGQYWIDGTATPPANAVSFSGTSATIATSTLAGGIHTVHVRVQDGTTNWSAVSSAGLAVVQAVNDSRSVNANTSSTQTLDVTAASGLLANDLPAGSTAAIVSAPVRTSGTGSGTLAVSCPGSLGTAASPSAGGSTVCTNGAYRITLTGVGGSGNARRASKRGTFEFTYSTTYNGVTVTATVTITVN